MPFDWLAAIQSSETANPYICPFKGNDQRSRKGKSSFLIILPFGETAHDVSKPTSPTSIVTRNLFFIFSFSTAAQRLALPAGGRDARTPFCRNPLQAKTTA